MSEETTDEIREAQRAAYEGIREGWPSLWDASNAQEWRVECPKCKGSRVDEVLIREVESPLRINTRKTGIEGITGVVNAETSVGPKHEVLHDVYNRELKWLEEEYGITSVQEAMKLLDEMDCIPYLDRDRLLLPNGLYVKTKPDSGQKHWGDSDERWEKRMLYELTYQEVVSDADAGEDVTQKRYFKCHGCEYKTKSLRKVLKSKRRK